MALKNTLTAKNLEALGAPRLAELLVEVAASDAAVKRRLRLELAGNDSPRELAAAVRKRLAAIERSRSFVEFQGTRALAADLETQHRAIVGPLAGADPAEALDLTWRFLALADGVLGRCDDSNGTVGDVFDDAVASLGPIAQSAKAAPRDLAERAFDLLFANGYGLFDTLIAVLAPSLGAAGLEHLKRRLRAVLDSPPARQPDAPRRQIGWSAEGPVFAETFEGSGRRDVARLALQDIADAQGDADAYVALIDAKTRQVPRVAAAIATRLLAAGRAEAALAAIDAATPDMNAYSDFQWADARIAVLDALGRSDEAQAQRWQCFERALSVPHLRDHLKRLADFADVEAEQRALDLVARHDHALAALHFLVDWPALDRAAALVMARAEELDGNRYETLTPAANALAGRHKLAATMLLRAMIDYTLGHARSTRYRHAARHLADCAGLAAGIADFGTREPHDAYVRRLRATHGRKAAFWSLVA